MSRGFLGKTKKYMKEDFKEYAIKFGLYLIVVTVLVFIFITINYC